MKYVLIVEDDQFLIDAYRAKLQGGGSFEVAFAHDGDEAMAAIDKKRPDVIILDLLMPNKNGFDVLEGMKKKGIQIPVLVASNIGGNEDIDRAKKLGVSDYFIKANTSINEIIAKVETLAGIKS